MTSGRQRPLVDGFVLGQLAGSRSLGINYLLGIGPMPTGDLEPESYANMGVVAGWTKVNGAAVRAKPLRDGETASVPATGAGSTRYLFALPKFRGIGVYEKDMLPPVDETLTLSGITRPARVTLRGDGSALEHAFAGGVLTVHVPAAKRTTLVDVVRVELGRQRPRAPAICRLALARLYSRHSPRPPGA